VTPPRMRFIVLYQRIADLLGRIKLECLFTQKILLLAFVWLSKSN
jgi:hypothetical protein